MAECTLFYQFSGSRGQAAGRRQEWRSNVNRPYPIWDKSEGKENRIARIRAKNALASALDQLNIINIMELTCLLFPEPDPVYWHYQY